MRDGSFIRVKQDALDQVEAGADILDVNMGVAGMDQSPLMERAIFELSMLVETPLSIDTLDPVAMEIALKKLSRSCPHQLCKWGGGVYYARNAFS